MAAEPSSSLVLHPSPSARSLFVSSLLYLVLPRHPSPRRSTTLFGITRLLEIAGLRENRVLAARVSRPVSSPIHCAQLIFDFGYQTSPVIITCRDDFVYVYVLNIGRIIRLLKSWVILVFFGLAKSNFCNSVVDREWLLSNR